MASKTNLLKELGWDDELIRHFIIDDGIYNFDEEPESQAEVFESNTLTFTYNAQVSGQYVISQKDHQDDGVD